MDADKGWAGATFWRAEKVINQQRHHLYGVSSPGDEDSSILTLYACPREEKPYVQMAPLQEGRYVETSYLSLRTFISFSDVGRAARAAALEIAPDVTTSLVGYSWLEEDKSWIVVFESGKVNLVLSSQRYKHFGTYDKAFYITVGITGSPELARDFAARIQKNLGHNPCEGLDWDKLKELGITTKEEALAAWARYCDP